jgi:hypothetical protein
MTGAMEWATAPVIFLRFTGNGQSLMPYRTMMDVRKYKGSVDYGALAW